MCEGVEGGMHRAEGVRFLGQLVVEVSVGDRGIDVQGVVERGFGLLEEE